MLRYLLPLALLLSSTASYAEGEKFRSMLSSPVIFSSPQGGGSEEPGDGGGSVGVPLAGSVAAAPPAFAMVGERFSLPVSTSGGAGNRSVELVGTLPGVSGSADGLAGVLTTASSYMFGARVVDDAGTAPYSVGSWTIDVDPLLSVDHSNMPGFVEVIAGVSKTVPLPTVSGGYQTKSASILPADARVQATASGVRILAPQAGDVGDFKVRITDGRPGRFVDTPAFSVVAVPPLAASVADPVAIRMVGEPFNLPVTMANGLGTKSLVLTGSTPPGVNVTDNRITGVFNTAGTYTFGATASDTGGSPAVPLGPWSITVDPALTIAAMQDSYSLPSGTSTDITLPAASGGYGSLTYSVDPVDPRIQIVGTKLRVTPTAAGTIGTFKVGVKDGRPDRPIAYSHPFTLTATESSIAPTEALVSSVSSTGILVKSATSAREATADRGATNVSAAVRLSAGQTITVQYAQPIKSQTVTFGYVPPLLSCSGATAARFRAYSPSWTIQTSQDGVNWTTHTNEAGYGVSSTAHCGFLNAPIYLGPQIVFSYLRLTIGSAFTTQNVSTSVDVIALRAK